MAFRLFDFDEFFAADDRDNVAFSVLPLRLQDPNNCSSSAGCKPLGKSLDKSQRRDITAGPLSSSHIARTDIVEGRDECTVKIELPGIDKQDIRVHFDDAAHILTVEAERRSEHTEEGPEKKKNDSASSLNSGTRCQQHFFHQERFYGHIKRSMRLPDSVDGQNVTASLSDGILKLVFAKKPEQESRKLISID